MIANMDAELLLRERVAIDDRAFVELVIWRLPRTLVGSSHQFKYRLALVIDDICVLRYDNEAGKGDHRHVGGNEESYTFTSIDNLLADFWADVDQWEP
jgi:hypothetical protein